MIKPVASLRRHPPLPPPPPLPLTACVPPTHALRAAPVPNGSDTPTALVVLMPGAMLGPKDYDALFAAVKVSLVRMCRWPCKPGHVTLAVTTGIRMHPGCPNPAMQDQKEAGVQLWLSAPQIDWQYMMVGGGQGCAGWKRRPVEQHRLMCCRGS